MAKFTKELSVLALAIGIAGVSHASDQPSTMGEPITFKQLVDSNKNWTGVQVYAAEVAVSEERYDDASQHYIRAIRNGLSAASANLAVLIKQGRMSDEATTEAIEQIAKISRNDADLSAFLGDIYHTHPTLNDEQAAFRWLNNASRLGDVSSTLLVGQYILEKRGGADKVYSSVDALTLLKQYIDRTDDPIVTLELAKHLFEGKVIKRDYQMAAELFQKSSGAGVLEANYWLGYQHETGVGVARNTELAKRYYQDSLGSTTDAKAYYQLARVYMFDPEATEADKAMGASYLLQAHNLGNTEATYRYGIMYLYGTNGYALDIQNGIKYLELASEKGYRLATQKLIDTYRTGINGVKPSHAKVRQYERVLQEQ